MNRRWIPPVMMLSLFISLPAQGQEEGTGLAFLIPNIFGAEGFIELEADQPFNHEAHFGVAREGQFSDVLQQGRLLNIAFVTQLTALPLPSSASGITFGIDPDTGLPARRRQSFGPILTERAETVGSGRFNVSFGFQYFSFDGIDGVDLDGIPDAIAHCNCPGGVSLDFKDDVITLDTVIGGQVSQFTAFFTYGLHDRVDVSVAVPILRTDLDVTSVATIQRTGDPNPNIHHFEGGNPDQQIFSNSGSATGLGDIIVRLKGNPRVSDAVAVAAGLDVRLPSGDEVDLLGTGGVGVRPFFVVSGVVGNNVSPHVNLGYQWNGDSRLAGDLRVAGDEGDLPDQLFYAFGVDWGVHEQLTLVFDILGQQIFDAQRLRLIDTVTTPPPRETQLGFPNIDFEQASFNQTNAAIGFKVNPRGNLLVDFNLLFKLNDGGLRDTVTPLVGIEYGFGSF
ncbi:MAG TPA: transporter [Acidobacteriota bacterium]